MNESEGVRELRLMRANMLNVSEHLMLLIQLLEISEQNAALNWDEATISVNEEWTLTCERIRNYLLDNTGVRV
tara:strand:- start:4993 stop:5211 length:219 start_codon:yes stop_codon:yes gene_type:complete